MTEVRLNDDDIFGRVIARHSRPNEHTLPNEKSPVSFGRANDVTASVYELMIH